MTPVEAVPVWRSLAGGMLIGSGAALLWLGDGERAGISGILRRVLNRDPGTQGWRIAFLAGLVAPALAVGAEPVSWQAGMPLLAVAGVLVGLGTCVGRGCTSGHGICGLASLSPRSLAATLTFMGVATATVLALRAWGTA